MKTHTCIHASIHTYIHTLHAYMHTNTQIHTLHAYTTRCLTSIHTYMDSTVQGMNNKPPTCAVDAHRCTRGQVRAPGRTAPLRAHVAMHARSPLCQVRLSTLACIFMRALPAYTCVRCLRIHACVACVYMRALPM
jgi:hypothetical protein